MNKPKKDIYTISSYVLLGLGIVDLMRGFFHTFLVDWANSTFAQFDLIVSRNNTLFLLGLFGVSNILTGLIYILVSRKARQISPYVIAIIPIAYVVGMIGVRNISGIIPNATLSGKYFMSAYMIVCVVTVLHFLYRKKKANT